MIPIVKNIMLNMPNANVVFNAFGTGLQVGKVCCLNFDYFNFSTFSLIFYFSSGVTSILNY